jgi:glycosyltransferase involved in cell wall biosynthesis
VRSANINGMKILFLHSGDRVPSARFRALPYARHFRHSGHTVTLAASFPQKYDFFPGMGFRPSQLLKRLVRWWHLQRCRWGRYDCVVVDREVFDDATWDWEASFRKCVPAFVLDVDDGIFLRHPEKFGHLLRMSDLVVAGNSYLAEKIRETNQQTVVVPTCVELASYPEKAESAAGNAPVVIGWMGTTGNLIYLNVVAEALRNLALRCGFELRVIAAEAGPLRQIDLTGVTVTFVPWRGATEVDELRRIDVGLMPLFADDPWNRYKCGLKLIQYMAIGIPGVASPVGVNADIVEHGVDGFLASTTREWEDVLFKLIQQRELRRTVGGRARLKVAEKYSIEANYPLLEQSLLQTLTRVRGKT